MEYDLTGIVKTLESQEKSINELVKIVKKQGEQLEELEDFALKLSRGKREDYMELMELRNRVCIIQNAVGIHPRFTLYGRWTVRGEWEPDITDIVDKNQDDMLE